MSVTTDDHTPFFPTTEVSSLESAMQFAAAAGVKLTASDYRQIAELQALQNELEAPAPDGWSIQRAVDTFNRRYPEFLNFMHRVGDTVITLMQTVIVALGNPAILLLLLYVEHERVKHGLKLFETSDSLAWLGAWAIVLLNLTLEFTIHYSESRAGYHAARATRFSLRSWGREIKYFFGAGNDGKDWQPIQLSPAQQYRNLSRIVTMTILILALAGSMRPAIEGVSAAAPDGTVPRWNDALQAIAQESTLLEMSTWLSGLMFAFAAILGVQRTASYIAVKCAEIISRNQQQGQGKDERAAVQYIMAKVSERQARAAAPTNGNGHSEVAASPFLAVTKVPNGNGNGHH